MKVTDRTKRNRVAAVAAVLLTAAAISWGCPAAEEPGTAEGGKKDEKAELHVLAAASMTDVCEELKREYEKEENVNLIFSFGSSGALQAQIEEGAPCDLFISAGVKQMDALRDEGLVEASDIEELLENELVLIVPEGNPTGLGFFEDVVSERVNIIGVGDPAGVPAGQYAQEVFENLGLWEQVQAKANYGTDVRNVLAWVESGSVDCGIVYRTDAETGRGIEIICGAPKDSCSQIIYPAAIIKDSRYREGARRFLQYMEGVNASKIFKKYGFKVIK